jgi:polyphosphate kinase 2 (PPK2 family)
VPANRKWYRNLVIARAIADTLDLMNPRGSACSNACSRFATKWVSYRTTILKFFLHISKDEQKRRLQSRLDDQSKHLKFSSADAAIHPASLRIAEQFDGT